MIAALIGVVPVALLRLRDGWLAYAGALAAVLATVGIVVYPRIDAVRSGRAFMERVEQASAPFAELGLASAKEQYLLELRRPSYNFGHARWREREVEAADAAAWLAERPGRALLVDQTRGKPAFPRPMRSNSAGRTGNTGTSYRVRRTRIAYAAATTALRACTCRQMPL